MTERNLYDKGKFYLHEEFHRKTRGNPYLHSCGKFYIQGQDKGFYL